MRLFSCLSLLLACSGGDPSPAPSAPKPPPFAGGGTGILPGPKQHALFLVIDTLRYDEVEAADTPVLDLLRAEGQWVDHAWASSTWTAPSVVSMFTGMAVREHGWDFPFPSHMENRTASYAQVPDVPVLAEVLEQAGLRTTGIYGNPLLAQGLGYDRGFGSFTYSKDAKMAGKVAAEVATWAAGERHFLYVHMFGCHHPLRPSKAAIEKQGVNRAKWFPQGRGFSIKRAHKAGLAGLTAYKKSYRAVVEDIDRRVGRVLEALGPQLKDTLVVVTADHGEMLGEHGVVGHERWLWDPLTHVPLVVVGAAHALPMELSTAAIPDLLTEGLGIPHTWPTGVGAPGPLVSQREGKLAISEDGRTKAIWDPEAISYSPGVYDLVDDPRESRNRAERLPALQRAREAFEAAIPEHHLEPADSAMDDTMLDALQALGYMGDGEEEPAPRTAAFADPETSGASAGEEEE